MLNNYPKDLIEKQIKRFLSKKFTTTNVNDDIVKEVKYVTLPFLGHFSYQLRNTLSCLLRKHVPNVEFRFIFTNKKNIGSLFRFKDSIPTSLCSKIAYSFWCPGCKSRYIGSTYRNLKIRIAEHRGVSYRTNTRITHPSFSEIN